MKRILLWALVLVLLIFSAGCAQKPSATDRQSGDATQEVAAESTAAIGLSADANKGDDLQLPASYPKDTLPLAADAKILDVRENPANKGLEVSYVSDNDIDTLCDFYEAALKDGKDLTTLDTADGYIITATMDGVGYNIILSKDAMKPNPLYAGKISVYMILSGLEGISDNTQLAKDGGEEWPSAELPGLPQLKGHISQILRQDGIIRLEITVENADMVESYIGELTAAGFRFDTQPDPESDHMEFLAFKDNSMMSFAYKGEENSVSIEYQN